MSIETLEAEIARLRNRFRTLNQQHFDGLKYKALSEMKEEAISQIADQIWRLQMTRSKMLADAIEITGQRVNA